MYTWSSIMNGLQIKQGMLLQLMSSMMTVNVPSVRWV